MADNTIFPKNLWGTPGALQHDTHFSGATKALYFLFEAVKHAFVNSFTGESDTANKTKYVSIQDIFVGNTLKCNKLNEWLWIYNMVDFIKILNLKYHNAIYTKFISGGEDNKVYFP